MAALGRLVGAVAHEINNPLAGILATSQILLQEDEKISPSLRDDLEEVRSAAWRSKKIIDDLLGFTSHEEHGLESADAEEAVKTSLLFCKAALKDVKVSQQIDNNLPKIQTSIHALQQVIFNLITNAVHAMNGKGAIYIEITHDRDDVLLTIRDEGPGISPDRLKHIFDPFFTSKQEGRGTGLGLSIVKNLIQKIQARIEVESTVGKGTKFTIYLPSLKSNNGKNTNR
jgi:signal transduction histidine kinase